MLKNKVAIITGGTRGIGFAIADAFKNIMNLNVTAVFNGCKAVVPFMKEAGGGSIINTSSMVAKFGQQSGVGYPASKFAVNGMTQSLARELGTA